MIIATLAFAYWAFLIAYNLLQNLWKSVLVAIATFFVSLIAITYDVIALLVIVIVALLVLTLVLVLGKK